MADDPQPSLGDLLRRLEIVLSEPVDFARTDTATTLAKVRLLTAAATYFNILAVTDFGGRSGAVRAEGLVEHAVGAAFQTFEGIDPHPGHFEKAAMLLRGITQGHVQLKLSHSPCRLKAAWGMRRRRSAPTPDPCSSSLS